jgi:hypothetical protein
LELCSAAGVGADGAASSVLLDGAVFGGEISSAERCCSGSNVAGVGAGAQRSALGVFDRDRCAFPYSARARKKATRMSTRETVVKSGKDIPVVFKTDS